MQKSELKPSRDGFTQQFKIKAPWHYMTQLQQSQHWYLFPFPAHVLSFIHPEFGSLCLPGILLSTGDAVISFSGVQVHRGYGVRDSEIDPNMRTLKEGRPSQRLRKAALGMQRENGYRGRAVGAFRPRTQRVQRPCNSLMYSGLVTAMGGTHLFQGWAFASPQCLFCVSN